VSDGPGSPTALIVDDDIGFVLWLGEMLNESGYQAIPALNSRQAMTLVKDLKLQVDVLVVNPKLRGAARTVKTLETAQPRLRVVLISDPSAPAKTPDPKHATLERPSAWEPISRPLWITRIRKVLLRPSAVQ
jgi:DNA-binding NtrC family response regulator